MYSASVCASGFEILNFLRPDVDNWNNNSDDDANVDLDNSNYSYSAAAAAAADDDGGDNNNNNNGNGNQQCATFEGAMRFIRKVHGQECACTNVRLKLIVSSLYSVKNIVKSITFIG